jgi:hypothetical protein
MEPLRNVIVVKPLLGFTLPWAGLALHPVIFVMLGEAPIMTKEVYGRTMERKVVLNISRWSLGAGVTPAAEV